MSYQRWTRIEAGVYTLGDWTIQGKGTHWTLLRDGISIRYARGKKELQQRVANGESARDAEPAEAAPSHARRATVAPVDSVESVLASLRFEVEQLTLAVRELNARLNKEHSK